MPGPWVLLAVIFLILLIPLVAILLDSELGRALARRLEPDRPEADVEERLTTLEDEMEYVSEAIRSIQAQLRSRQEPSDGYPGG